MYEVFMKCVNVVENFDEDCARFVICCWRKKETGQTLDELRGRHMILQEEVRNNGATFE